MYIIKRDLSRQRFMPNKILTRIKQQSKDLNIKADKLFQKVIPHIKDEMTATDIDEIIAFQSADLQIEHPDYAILGGRILISRQAKILEVETKEVDEKFDSFAASTFLKKYSMKSDNGTPVEIPSMMHNRVANHLYPDSFKERRKLLNELYEKKINFATPILSNSGIEGRNGLISCNLTTLMDDSIEGINATLDKIAHGSKEGSGIGLCIDRLRSSKSMVSSFKGYAGGVVRFADMVQSKMRFFKQGNRSGSCALYLSTWHKDILPFLELRLPIGEELNRARDLFTAVTIDDVFMDALINGKKYYLFCPNDIKKAGLKPFFEIHGQEFKEVYNEAVMLGLGEEVDPKKIWDAIIRSQVESGTPYVFFKDNANKINMQDNIGIINQSNLCISEDSILEVKIGDTEFKMTIKEVVDKFNNGEEIYVKSNNISTDDIEYKLITNGALMSENSEVLIIEDEETGKSIKCTPEHKIFTKNRGYVLAKDIKEDDVLEIN